MAPRMGGRRWALVAVLVAAVGLPVVCQPPPGRPFGETDLDRVYVRLEWDWDRTRLRKWCDLPVRDATEDEARLLRRAVEGDSRRWLVRTPIARDWFRDGHRPSPSFLDRLSWVRVSDPADRNLWIGLGVHEQYNSRRLDYWITYRVPVGFDPPEM